MAKYKCSDPKCTNKDKTLEPGYCPECGKKLRKSTNIVPIILIGGVIVLLLLGGLIYAAMTMPLNTTQNNTSTVSNQTSTPVAAENVFENQYVKFTIPTGLTVEDNSTSETIAVYLYDGKELVGEVSDGKVWHTTNIEAAGYKKTTLNGKTAYTYSDSAGIGFVIVMETNSQGDMIIVGPDFDPAYSDALNTIKNSFVVKKVPT